MKYLFLFLFAFSSSLYASRGPAVDPVTGISIEEYTETTPSAGQGFDFKQTDTYFDRAPTDTSLSLTTIAFLFFASSLPFIVWFGVMRALPDGAPVQSSTSGATPKLSVVRSDKNDSHDHDEERNWPKAS